MIDWQKVFATYPDDVDSVIAKRLGVATSTVWKARTNRKAAIIEAAAVNGVTMSAWVLRACERALEDL